MDEDKILQHYEQLHSSVYEDIKKRVEQRDRLSTQQVLSLAAIFTFAISKEDNYWVLIFIPLVSLFFTFQIINSYRLHTVLHQYITEVVEPKIAEICKTPVENEIQTYIKNNTIASGLRKIHILTSAAVSITSTITVLVVSIPVFNEFLEVHNNVILVCSAFIILFIHLYLLRKISIQNQK